MDFDTAIRMIKAEKRSGSTEYVNPFPTIESVFDHHIAKNHPEQKYRVVFPHWLEPFVDRLQLGEQTLDVCMSCPPQHGKSTLVFAWLIWMSFRPEYASATSLYLTYASHFAQTQRNTFCSFLRSVGIEPVQFGMNRVSWQTLPGKQHVVEFATPIAGVTGKTFTGVLVADDVIKASDSQSMAMMEKTWSNFVSDTLVRVQGPRLCVQTRWSKNDLVAHLVNEGWDLMNIPCESEGDGDLLGRPEGEFLWPEKWNADNLRLVHNDVRTWTSLYQGKPLEDVIGLIPHCEPATQADINAVHSAPVIYGIDLADTGNDWAVIVRLAAISKTEGIVCGVRRSQLPIEQWLPSFADFVKQRPGRVFLAYGGQEGQIVRNMIKPLIPTITIVSAVGKGNPQVRYAKTIRAIAQHSVRFWMGLPAMDDHVASLYALQAHKHTGTDDLQAVGEAYQHVETLFSGDKPPVGRPDAERLKRRSTKERWGHYGAV